MFSNSATVKWMVIARCNTIASAEIGDFSFSSTVANWSVILIDISGGLSKISEAPRQPIPDVSEVVGILIHSK
jgi:hypothetical protein